MELVYLILTGLLMKVCYDTAGKKNRNQLLWALLGFFFGIFAAIVIALLPPVV